MKTKFSPTSDGTIVRYVKRPLVVPSMYRTIIFGEEHIVKGWNGENLLTDKGDFIFRRLNGRQVDSEWPGEIPAGAPSNHPVQSMTLLEVATLQPDGNGGWLLNGHALWPLELMPAGCRLNGITRSEVLRVYKGQIQAVAWIQSISAGSVTFQLDTVLADWKAAKKFEPANAKSAMPDSFYRNQFIGWSKPIWLTEFHATDKKETWFDGLSNVLEKTELSVPPSLDKMLEKGVNPYLYGLDNIPAQTENAAFESSSPKKRKAKTARRSLSVARFENDFSLALIPQKNGNDKSLTIEPELLSLIKKIINAGGNLPRTKLRAGKSDTYQPEKLLMSRAAKTLIKAKLLGTTKSGRTTVYWAKQSSIAP